MRKLIIMINTILRRKTNPIEPAPTTRLLRRTAEAPKDGAGRRRANTIHPGIATEAQPLPKTSPSDGRRASSITVASIRHNSSKDDAATAACHPCCGSLPVSAAAAPAIRGLVSWAGLCSSLDSERPLGIANLSAHPRSSSELLEPNMPTPAR
jgi:hypothetical protein